VTGDAQPLESVESFRLRARQWIPANLPRLADEPRRETETADERAERRWRRARELQRILYAGGFAGICYPREYGGLGLTPAHQRAFNDEVVGYDMPLELNQPNFTICSPTILDMGTEEQKREHLAAAIRGDRILAQFLSEPTGGSDLAGATTRALPDGNWFVLTGSKIWSSGAYAADYALCLARTDWDAPKHRGLTMFLLDIHLPGVEVRRIRQADGRTEFCQEFFDDVRVPVSSVIGEVNDGWRVATRQLVHERNAVGGASPYFSGPLRAERERGGMRIEELIELVRKVGRADDPVARSLVADFHVAALAHSGLIDRVAEGARAEKLPATSGALIRLSSGELHSRQAEIELELAGPAAVISGDSQNEPPTGVRFLMRQAGSIGGGSTEMARNAITERILGMPREPAADLNMPFKDVKRGRSTHRPS
jgi:alkylation response protein AidB-like acyl-CoA dehydrogenase